MALQKLNSGDLLLLRKQMEVSWSIASEQSRHRALRFEILQARACPTADRLDIQQMV
jgi:hypothetical protein